MIRETWGKNNTKKYEIQENEHKAENYTSDDSEKQTQKYQCLERNRKKDELVDKILEMIIWLQPLCNLKPESKLSDEGSVFSAFSNTFFGRIYRSLFTQDSGKQHAVLILHKYREYKILIHDCILLEDAIDDDCYDKICNLLEKSAIGLTNFKEHQDYKKQSVVTSTIQFVIDFLIPQMIKLIKERKLPRRNRHVFVE